MTTTTSSDSPATGDLPLSLCTFLTAHAAHDVGASLQTFTADVIVIDQGERYVGTARAREFLERAGSEFTYTTELLTVDRQDADRWVVGIRLEGDFPGGVADLDYRFGLDHDLIRELTIAGART